MRSRWLAVAGVLGALGVGLGAFGAHGLKEKLSPEMLAIYEVGVRYQMYHTLAMVAAALAIPLSQDGRWLARANAAWLVGIAIFSGSLYALAITGARWLGAITPIGGVAFIVGWCCVAAAGLRAGPRDRA